MAQARQVLGEAELRAGHYLGIAFAAGPETCCTLYPGCQSPFSFLATLKSGFLVLPRDSLKTATAPSQVLQLYSKGTQRKSDTGRGLPSLDPSPNSPSDPAGSRWHPQHGAESFSSSPIKELGKRNISEPAYLLSSMVCKSGQLTLVNANHFPTEPV